jgi:large subunit ribosomal protein L13
VRTFTPKAGDITRSWYLIDAQDVVLGRLATHAAHLLYGKHKTTFAPHMDMGDFVVVINAEKVVLTEFTKVCSPTLWLSRWYDINCLFRFI